MKKIKLFIDGKEGTTGLRIFERVANRPELEILTLPEEQRKDVAGRKQKINESDITILCLPDAGAIESVSLIENLMVKVIDASTAHRTADGWTYGFPELNGNQKELISKAKRVANPGCHASGFIAVVAPLIQSGIVKKTDNLSCFSLTGYSGGGKKMIAEYENAERDKLLDAPRLYGLTQKHKHLKEMSFVTGLEKYPVFNPIVAPFYAGMAVTVPFDGVNENIIYDALKTHYANSKFIKVEKADGFLSAGLKTGYDDMTLYVCGGEERVTVTAVFDNLGKGASGAAIQNLNIMLGLDETYGLKLGE